MHQHSYDPLLKQLGQRIRTIRKELHLTQGECASMCDIDRAYLSRLERGGRNTSVLHLAKLAHGLGIDVVHFFKN